MKAMKIASKFLLLLFITSSFSINTTSLTQVDDPEQESFTSVAISQTGLDFIKNLLITKAISAIIPLELPKIGKIVKIPFVGNVRMVLLNITIYGIDVLSSYVKPGESGVAIIASGTTCNLSMNWFYEYSTWLEPVKISDKGSASVQVEGMEVVLALGLENQKGAQKYLYKIGWRSLLYQGMVNAFEGPIGSAVENAIPKELKEGILKFDSFLQSLPKEIPVDDHASLNVTFVDNPLLTSSCIGFDINGLFTARKKTRIPNPNYHYKNLQLSVLCTDQSKMLGISLDEAVLNSALALYYDDLCNGLSMKYQISLF